MLSEAKRLKIPIIAVIDSINDLESVDYPIVGNDGANVRSSLSILRLLMLIKFKHRKFHYGFFLHIPLKRCIKVRHEVHDIMSSDKMNTLNLIECKENRASRSA